MVVGGEVPAAGMDDEAVWTELAPRLVPREGSIRDPDAAPPTDGLGEHEHRVPRHRRIPRRARGEVEGGLERLDAASQTVRKHPVDLRERALDRLLRARQPEPPGGLHAERDRNRLVVGEHQRRQAIARPDAIAAADPSLTLDRNPEVLERLDVPANRPRVDLELVRDLAACDQGFRLQELEELEKPRRGCQHGRSRPQIEGLTRPISAIASRSEWTTTGGTT